MTATAEYVSVLFSVSLPDQEHHSLAYVIIARLVQHSATSSTMSHSNVDNTLSLHAELKHVQAVMK